jgi:hypothetical protein
MMSAPKPPAPEHEPRLDEAVLDYLEANEAGQALSPQEWLARHPDLAQELGAFLANHAHVERLAAPLRALADRLWTDDATLPLSEGSGQTAEAPRARDGSFGDYEVLGRLGQGGMGVVYKARQVSLERTVALKMILHGAHASAQELSRLRTEAQSLAQLEHPNIVHIYEVGEHDGLPFLSLEFIDGGSLADKLDGTPVQPAEAVRLVEALAGAMHAAHSRNVVHRDLKPGNILLTADGTPKITDFGLAKRLDETAGAGQTQPGDVLGTPSYMAPEQAAGKANEVGPVTDVYALGAILYEALTGRPPFRAATPLDTVRQVLEAEPVSPRLLNPRVTRDLETICLKCLQKEPARRYASARELADELKSFQEGRPIRARPVGAPERFRRWCRRHPARAAALGVSILLLLVVLIGGFWFNRRLRGELGRTEAAQRELQQALTRQAAERLDAELRQFAVIPEMLAAALERRADWKEAELEELLRGALGKHERVFGSCVAFEPGRFDPARKDFALYVYRSPEGLKAKQLLPPDYHLYRDWDWYRQPKAKNALVWTEPFLDEGATDVWVITCAVPIRRGGQFAGVATIDLRGDSLDNLKERLQDLKLKQDGYGFVVSREGVFISHPDRRFRMPGKITTAAEFQTDDRLRAFTERLLREERGAASAVDPSTGRPSSFLFARVPSAGWSFVAVLGE